METTGNTILITGGSGGIGGALARRFHDADNDVVITGRRRDALDAVAEGRQRMAAYEVDVADAAAVAAPRSIRPQRRRCTPTRWRCARR